MPEGSVKPGMMLQSHAYLAEAPRRGISYIRLGEIVILCLCVTFLAVAARQAMAAPIRFFAAPLWYLPDAMVAGSLILGCAYSIICGRSSTLFIVLFLMIWVTASLILLNFQSVLFGMRMMMAIGVAFIVGLKGQQADAFLRKCLFVLAAIAILGVFFESILDVPWKGAEFSGALGTKQISRQWWSEADVVRIAGFGISSTDTALFIACAMLLLAHGAQQPARTKGLLLLLPAVYAISLTQQKATMVWFAALWALSALAPIFLGQRVVPLVGRALKALSIAALIGGMLAPFAFYKVDIAGMFGYSAPSLLDRTSNVWPGAIERIATVPQFLLGNGIGSVGEAASFTDERMSVPPDNLFLYVYIMSGIAIFAVFLKLFLSILRLQTSSYTKIPALSVLTLLLLNGVTANILEGLVGTIFLGFTIGVCMRSDDPLVSSQTSIRKPKG